jgi:hypothetical protein
MTLIRAMPTLVALSIMSVGCGPVAREERPRVADSLIAALEAAPKKDPPAAVWSYTYKGDLVFYVPPSCCDVPSELYDSAGTLLCSPDGGFTGKGDGRCPDFFATRNNGKRLWADPR